MSVMVLAKNLSGGWVYEPRLMRVRGVKFSTFYPGGICGGATFFVPHEARTVLEVRAGYEIRIYEGLVEAWRGVVMDLEEYRYFGQSGTLVSCVGHWGGLLGVRSWNKRWADDRIGEELWVWDETEGAEEKCTIDRYNRIRFTPKAVAWINNDQAAVRYTMPTGETIKRVTLNYDFQEAAQAWIFRLRDEVGGVNIWSLSVSGTGSRDDTLGTPRQALELQFQAGANQTPAADGTIYGQVSNVMVYSETGAIDLTAVAGDVRGKATALSANEHLIASNGYDLSPFISNYQEFLSSILERAAAFGDSSQNPWAVGVKTGFLASDDKPILFAEQQPSLTGTPSYEVSLRGAEVGVRRNVSEVFNWVVVQYRDSRGVTLVVTPDDDATLENTDSIAKYGERHAVLDVDFSSLAQAKNYAKRFLAKYKEPTYAITSPVRVTGTIRHAGGAGYTPASLVQAGKTVRITDFLPDLSGAGLVLLITSTAYDDATRTVELGFGHVDPLQVAVVQRKA